ncbi:hypothetical protein GBA63_08195 [Rubrobacter tropicus]|uniref:Uncharacterized protein n=1 Tax=Rubrobacter tropicus TaxID=2653851 RepID=A0A6G8Q810_9ACTN|nr:hypothetical protein GBA63_08195 [Rubrobacter tropicus]
MKSLPSPPKRRSESPRPIRVSPPPRPRSVSFSAVPTNLSGPLSPVRLSARAVPPKIVSIRPVTATSMAIFFIAAPFRRLPFPSSTVLSSAGRSRARRLNSLHYARPAIKLFSSKGGGPRNHPLGGRYAP